MTVKDLLSQDEIDALLHGVDDGDIETEEGFVEDEGAVKAYDLASHERIVRGRMPTLEMINERFAPIPVSLCLICYAITLMSRLAACRS